MDYDKETLNIDVGATVAEIRGGDVSAVILAHTLGVPVNLGPILEACRDTGTLLIEDCCEAVGATLEGRQVGSFGAASTFSFYPSHQITALGGGGMVCFRSERHYRRAKSLRDWGKRSDWDSYGRNNTAYSADVDGGPYFPHYAYETVGWNFKLPEANCAFGREQNPIQLWIDEDSSGAYEADEKHVMAKLGGGGVYDDNNYINGERYTKTLTLYRNGGGEVKYKFYASDGQDIATDTPTTLRTVYVDNMVPTLVWPGDADYETDGVNPDSGPAGGDFTFPVLYTDADNLDNTSPSTTQIWIDKNDNGVSSADEQFDMTQESGSGAYHDGSYANGELLTSAAGWLCSKGHNASPRL